MQENKQFNAVQADLLQLAGLLTEDRWCQGPVAVDASGQSVPVLNSEAARWCLYGGIIKTVGRADDKRAERMYDALWAVRGEWASPIRLNDDKRTTHRQVQEYIMRAVEHTAT